MTGRYNLASESPYLGNLGGPTPGFQPLVFTASDYMKESKRNHSDCYMEEIRRTTWDVKMSCKLWDEHG